MWFHHRFRHLFEVRSKVYLDDAVALDLKSRGWLCYIVDPVVWHECCQITCGTSDGSLEKLPMGGGSRSFICGVAIFEDGSKESHLKTTETLKSSF